MKAVNLIPKELRGASAPGRSGMGVYAVLGVLAAAVVLATAWGLASRSVTQKQNDVTRVTNEATLAEQRAGELEPYKRFADVRIKRTATVSGLARSRFNWPYALREVSRVIPADTWLSSVVGTVAPGVTVEDVNGGESNTMRGLVSSPALELAGCSTSQERVAKYLASLRRIEGVTRVSLLSSEKLDTQTGSGGAPGGGGGSSGDCRQGNSRIPKFGLVVFFERSTATASTATPGTTPAAATAPTTPAQTGATK